MRFEPASGLAGWAHAQMQVRYGQAKQIRPLDPAEERPVNEVRGAAFVCDLPLLDEAAALDAVATLGDANVLGRSLPLEVEVPDGSSLHPDPRPSFVEYHLCGHAEGFDPCLVVSRSEGPGGDGPGDGGVVEWAPGQTVAAGDLRGWAGVVYVCVQGHTTQAGWEPPNVPALWTPQ